MGVTVPFVTVVYTPALPVNTAVPAGLVTR